MKSFLIALFVLTPVIAKSASPEETYLASRDAYIAKFEAIDNAGKTDDDVLTQHELAIDELGKLLRPIVGPVAIKGFPAEGKANLDSLSKGYIGFGLLDGLLFSSSDDKTHVVVTMQSLFDRWLRQHKDWWEPTVANVPQEVNAALKSEAFYTQALRGDAAIYKYVELPVVKPAKAKFAFAMFAARSQDLGLSTPDELIVSVVQAGRVFLVTTPANAKIDPMPTCQQIRQEAERKEAEAQDAGTRVLEEGAAAFRRCFAPRAKNQDFFAVLTRQAQALVDRLPSK